MPGAPSQHRPAAPRLPSRAPLVVGILNLTPDSFFDGGRYVGAHDRDGVDAAVARAREMVAQGADWIDVGGESTRPGAAAVSAADEIARVVPVIREIAGLAPVSIDTSKARVAAAALEAGATIVNDVTGLSDPDMPAVTADARATVVMHTRGTPRDMASRTAYDDLLSEVRGQLLEAAARARSPEVWLDPGIGFAKTARQSLALLRHLDRLVDTGLPVYVGASRKSFIGHTLGLPDADDRLAGSLAAAAAAWRRGARALRVHDVAETRQLLDLLVAIERADEDGSPK